jgi:hypothetical protein
MATKSLYKTPHRVSNFLKLKGGICTFLWILSIVDFKKKAMNSIYFSQRKPLNAEDVLANS